MQKINELMQAKAQELLAKGEIKKVLAWKAGEFFYDNAPAAFESEASCSEIIYNEFCPANLSKYLMASSKAGVKTAVFLKPCDTYGVNQLIKDNRVNREMVYAVGTPCSGRVDGKKIKAAGYKTLLKVEVNGDKIIVTTPKGQAELAKKDFLYNKCLMCKGNDYMICDEELAETQYAAFLEGLETLLAEIADPTIPITKNKDSMNCSYCPYKELCDRL